jgi:hypothetical protein
MDLTINRTPMSRGVTQLMYVGDDDAVETAVAPPKPTTKDLAIGAVAALVALQSRGVTRLAAAGVAGYIGYRAYKSR